MNKNELEFQKVRISGEKFRAGATLASRLATVGGGVWAISIIMEGLAGMVAGQSADSIGALAKVVEALNLGSVVGYIWGAGATVAWKMERAGKKRMTGEKGRFQKLAESSDAYRSSSGLNDQGHEPGGEDE